MARHKALQHRLAAVDAGYQEMLGELHARDCTPRHLARPTAATIYEERQASSTGHWDDIKFDPRIMRHAR